MTYSVLNGYVHGLGIIRVDPEPFGAPDFTAFAKAMKSDPTVHNFLTGPIRVYGRGDNDLRLEYDFSVPMLDCDRLAGNLYRHIAHMCRYKLSHKGKLHHSHYLGVKVIS